MYDVDTLPYATNKRDDVIYEGLGCISLTQCPLYMLVYFVRSISESQ